jgi:hypothetical protein
MTGATHYGLMRDVLRAVDQVSHVCDGFSSTNYSKFAYTADQVSDVCDSFSLTNYYYLCVLLIRCSC